MPLLLLRGEGRKRSFWCDYFCCRITCSFLLPSFALLSFVYDAPRCLRRALASPADAALLRCLLLPHHPCSRNHHHTNEFRCHSSLGALVRRLDASSSHRRAAAGEAHPLCHDG